MELIILASIIFIVQFTCSVSNWTMQVSHIITKVYKFRMLIKFYIQLITFILCTCNNYFIKNNVPLFLT